MRPPWERLATVNFHKAMDKKSDSTATNKMHANNAINTLTPSHEAVAFTDGSAHKANTNGGAGVYFTKPLAITITAPTGRYTSSCSAEMSAIHLSLQTANNKRFSSTIIITDSLSSWGKIRSLTKGAAPKDLTETKIMDELTMAGNHNRSFSILWSPSHCGVEGNDKADELANSGAQMDQSNAHWNFTTAKARIKAHLRKRRIHTQDHDAVYNNDEGNTNIPNHKGLSRADQVLASRIRSNHHPDTMYWRHKMGLAEDSSCRLCKMEVESAHHIVQDCPAIITTTDDRNVLLNSYEISRRWKKWKSKIALLDQ